MTAVWCGQCYEPFDSASRPSQADRPVGGYATTAVLETAPPIAPSDPWAPAPGWSVADGGVASGRLLSRRATAVVGAAIGVGAVGDALIWLIGRGGRLEPEVLVRYVIVEALVVYAIVGGLIITQLTPAVRLRWTQGRALPGAAVGLAVGGLLGLVLLGLVSAAAGHLSPDPRIVALVSEGDLTHILAAFLIGCVAAPLVEETLFRGLLLESLLPRGRGAAIWLSGLAFAAWHLNPSALRYYALMGALFGYLYTRRGLVCSMSAHLAFNGVLTVAAVALALTPAHLVTAGDISLRVPQGWSTTASAIPSFDLTLRGPSTAEVLILHLRTPGQVTTAAILERLTAGRFNLPGVTLDVGGVADVQLPAGEAVEVSLRAQGHHGRLVLLPRPGRIYEVVFASGGSVKATADFDAMLRSLTVG